VLSFIQFRVDEKKQKLGVTVDPRIPRHIVGDDQRLAQVITNLLSNAAKFTPEGGEITLGASLVRVDGDTCEIRVAVTDSGIGISQEQQKKLFGTFSQAESGTSRKYGGTGLGLAISKRIVEMMGGEISVESELGKGARFAFTFKAGIAAVPAGADASMGGGLRGGESADGGGSGDGSVGGGGETPISGEISLNIPADGDNSPRSGEFKGKSMLLAEDVDVNREIMQFLLEDSGIGIDCAENGQEALDMVAANPGKYDVVFMDMQMPVMDGCEATRRIRALPDSEAARLPIIAMTANVFREDVETCLEAGMDDHIGKPVDIGDVYEKLRKHLN
jgi:CheY-like chemotaxis protein/anti-sigma regulatory factor (Ser/Thr protein kinase)